MSLQDKTYTVGSTAPISKSSFFSNNFDSDESSSDSSLDDITNINTEAPSITFEEKLLLFGQVRGRKSNTYIKGWKITNEEMLTHLSNLKKTLGCNGSIQEKFLYEGEECKVLHLQGNKIAKVSEYLTKLGVTNVYVKPID